MTGHDGGGLIGHSSNTNEAQIHKSEGHDGGKTYGDKAIVVQHIAQMHKVDTCSGEANTK